MPVTDPVWLGADDLIKAQLWAVAEQEVLREKRASLLLGESVEGGKLLPIHQLTRYARKVNIDYTKPPRGKKPYSPMGKADPANAPLVSTGNRARAVVLSRTAVVPGGIWGYWDRDPHTGRYWGEILYKHRTGFQQTFYGPQRRSKASIDAARYSQRKNRGFRLAANKGRVANIPSRDVIGLPPQRIARVKAKVEARWRQLRPTAERITRMDPRQPTPPAPNQTRQFETVGTLTARGFRVPTRPQQIVGGIVGAVQRAIGKLFGR